MSDLYWLTDEQMARLQPIANVGQRASGDRREGVDEIALREGRIERGRRSHAGGMASRTRCR